ncbi:MAG: glycosyltransferase family 2 protein [Acidaminococcaceae bacterium]|nr:glycosyltransferase family 2 protein [Acidaminococcaceae bacterium]
MSLVSVIIPVYKVEKYLRCCVDSVLNSTYQDLEIILVDDGSPDRCPQICDEYAERDMRIKVIHKENGGLSSARNAGLDIAKGDFIMFVDSDDWIDKETITTSVMTAKEHDADIVWFGIKIHQKGKAIIKALSNNMSFNDIVNYLLADNFYCSVWDKLYKNIVWKELRFPEGLLFEDAYVMPNILTNEFEIITINECFYNYRREENSGSILDKVALNPEEPYYRWRVEKNVCKFLECKNLQIEYKKILVLAIKHSLKMYIIDLATHCLTENRKKEIVTYLKNNYSNSKLLSLEYRLYFWSFKHWNFLTILKQSIFGLNIENIKTVCNL